LCSIDPKIGQAGGFGGIILHGLSGFGFAARAIIKTVANGDPSALKFFSVRFTAPVKPGDGLETQVWEVGPGPAGTTEVVFVTKNATSGKVSIVTWCRTSGLRACIQIALGSGMAYVRKSEKSKL
jgi:peroxisomal enoyl-CoA hydratase 2